MADFGFHPNEFGRSCGSRCAKGGTPICNQISSEWSFVGICCTYTCIYSCYDSPEEALMFDPDDAALQL